MLACECFSASSYSRATSIRTLQLFTLMHTVMSWRVTGWFVPAFLWLMVLPAPGFGDDAFFAIQNPPDPATCVVPLTDPVKIQHARDILAGKSNHSPHLIGT